MTALLAPFPKFKATDGAGATLPGALLYTYAAGTTTPLATCTDSTGAVFNTNPVVCNASGEANVWLTAGTAYKFVLTDSVGVVQWTVDQITGGLQGQAGDPGSTWRNGAGVPSDSIGSNGDYYLDTNTGDIYAKSTGAYGLVMNIKGPPGSSVNVIKNGSFYEGLNPWNSLASAPSAGVTPTAPSIGTGHTAASSAAQLLCPSTDFAVAKIYRGSVSQGFSIPVPQGTNTLTFWTTCYLETVSAFVSNDGYVKAYLFSQTAGTETLLQTYTLTATSATPVWTQQSIDLTASLPAQGDYGIRFEIQSACNNTGGTGTNKGTITAIDDITLLVTSAGVTGPTGATGPQGPAGPAGTATYLQKTTYTSNATYTTGPNTVWLDVTCTGGGGGGAGYRTLDDMAGGGGGAGGTIKKRIAVTASTGYAIVIGAAGTGGAVNASGTAGADTTFGATLVVGKAGAAGSVTGTGGIGGDAGVYLGGAAGTAGAALDVAATAGTSTTSHVNIDILAAIPGGGGGGGAFPNTTAYAGKAGGATDAYAGGVAFAGTGVAGEAYAGGGGSSAWGQGGRGANNAAAAPNKSDSTSPSATSYGAGGGGGCAFYGTGAGKNGASGVCVVEEIRG